jgi:uncharacterized membrane protein
MKTPASIAGHPIHPMLVPIAIGGFVISFVADLLCLATGNANPWNTVAYYTMLIGIAGALAAAIPGLIDLLSLPAGYTKGIAIKHMSINLLVVAIYVCNAWWRHGSPQDLKVPMIMSLVTVLMLLVSGWLGGKMVFEAGVGVNTENK